MNEVTDLVSALAVLYLDRILRSGKDVTIPSQGIVIKGDAIMIQRWDDLTPEEQARYEDREQLLAQLATAGQRNAELAETLHRRNATIAQQQQQLAAVTAERDAAVNHAQRAEIKLTNAWPRSDVMQLMQDVDDIIGGLDISNTAGAINWGDLGAAEAQIVWTEHYTWHYRVIIEEAEEECRALIDNVLAGLTARKWMGVEIETRW